MPLRKHKDAIEALYARLHRRRYVHPDPLELVYRYRDPRDREIVGLLAALLAYGRVGQILRSVEEVLRRVGPQPRRFVRESTPAVMRRKLAGFRHRFAGGEQVAALLGGVRDVLGEYGSLRACFLDGLKPSDRTVLWALGRFVGALKRTVGGACGHLLAEPAGPSGCKRYHLYLRWMVRCDEVDPGGWEAVGAHRLIVPLDTHMHRTATALGATRRRAPDRRAALEVTQAFRRLAPDDPVRYDFALTRLGIHPAGRMPALEGVFRSLQG